MPPKFNREITYERLFVGFLSLIPLLASLFPRVLGFFPALLGLGFFLAYRPVFGAWPRLDKPIFLWGPVLIFLMGISALWAIDPGFALERTLKTGLLCLGGTLLLAVVLEKPPVFSPSLNRIFPWVLLIAGIICVIDLYFHAPIHQYLRYQSFQPRFNATYVSALNRSMFGFSFCALLGFEMVRQSSYSSKIKVFLLIALAGLLAAVIYKTNSQSLQLAMILAIPVYLGFLYRWRVAWFLCAAVIAAALLTAPWLAVWLFKTLPPLVSDIVWFQDAYALARVEIWDFVAARVHENPLYGFGVEATRAIKDFETQKLYNPSAAVLHPHNFALQLWIEFGVIGALFGASFLTFVLMKIKTAGLPAARALLPIFIAVISVAATSYGLWQGWWLGLLFYLMALGALWSKTAGSD